MLRVFGEFIGCIIEAYVDDIVVKSKKIGDLVPDLTEVFAKLRQHGVKLNPEKCVFGFQGACSLTLSCRNAASKHETGQPTSKLTQTRNNCNTGQQRTHPDVHQSKNPPMVAPVRLVKSTGQTGVAWAARDEQHPRVKSPKNKPRSPESLHGLEQDFGDIRNTS
jgi:hypothetical protein